MGLVMTFDAGAWPLGRGQLRSRGQQGRQWGRSLL